MAVRFIFLRCEFEKGTESGLMATRNRSLEMKILFLQLKCSQYLIPVLLVEIIICNTMTNQLDSFIGTGYDDFFGEVGPANMAKLMATVKP